MSYRLFGEAETTLRLVSGPLLESVLLEPSSTVQYFWELRGGKAIKTLGFW